MGRLPEAPDDGGEEEGRIVDDDGDADDVAGDGCGGGGKPRPLPHQARDRNLHPDSSGAHRMGLALNLKDPIVPQGRCYDVVPWDRLACHSVQFLPSSEYRYW